MRACTTVSRRDLPRARVLADSFAAHHPGQRLHVLVTDDREGTLSAEGEAFELCLPGDLPLTAGEFERMSALYDAKELVTAVKFWQIRLLLEQSDEVLFLDSDVEIFAPLDDLGELCATYGVVVTPHSVAPIPLDGETPTELQIQRSGIYNTGFFGFGRKGADFLDWICERARRDFILDAAAGLWFDQRWFDFAPLLFDAYVSRDRSYNVAYWNLHERSLSGGDGRYLIDDRPLVFFHFSGFDPHRPELLTRVASRIRPVEGTALHGICADYAGKLISHGYDRYADVEYGFARVDGLEWTHERRRAYRRALVAAERGHEPHPPEPGSASFPAWLQARAPGSGRRLAHRLRRVRDRLRR